MTKIRAGLLQFVDLRGGGLPRKNVVMILREEVVTPTHTMFYVYISFLNNFFLFFINKNVFFSFSFVFCDEISNNYTRNLNQSKTRIGDHNMSAELHV